MLAVPSAARMSDQLSSGWDSGRCQVAARGGLVAIEAEMHAERRRAISVGEAEIARARRRPDWRRG